MEAPAFPAPDKHRAGAFYFFDPRHGKGSKNLLDAFIDNL
jgi:hypothetical protein